MGNPQSVNDLKKEIIAKLRNMKANIDSGTQPNQVRPTGPVTDTSTMTMDEARKFAINKAMQGKR